MEIVNEAKIELTGEECERIVQTFVEKKFSDSGFDLSYSRNESESPWPDMLYRGKEKE